MRVEVRAVEMALAEAMREYIEQRLRKAIAHAGDRVGGVTVEPSENHGPLGRADWRCRVIAEPLPSGAVVQREVVGPRLLAAIETASERLWCAVHGFPQDRSQAGAGG